MKKIKNIFIECDEATHYCDKSQYKEATFWEKIKLTIHLMYCNVCRKYSSRNGKLTKYIEESDIKTFEKNEKEELQTMLQRELSKEKG